MNGKLTHTIHLDGPYLDILSLQQSGFCCSQILVKLVLRDLGRDNPDLVRAMAALCYGGGHSGGTCGVLTGAACALSLSLGSGSGLELSDPALPAKLCELVDWFTEMTESSYGGSRCEDILTASPDKRACILLLIATIEKLQSMLATAGSAVKGRDHGHP